MPGSYSNFKNQIISFICNNINENGTILDVGPGCGTYYDLLKFRYKNIDACEIFKPYIERFELEKKYRKVYNENILNFNFEYYDLIIMGDILEHLSIEDAQSVLNKICNRCRHLIVAVPYRYPQGVHEDNVYEVHLQDDLTPEIMEQRYPQLVCAARDEVIGIYIKR